jgi:hypothetical protein
MRMLSPKAIAGAVVAVASAIAIPAQAQTQHRLFPDSDGCSAISGYGTSVFLRGWFGGTSQPSFGNLYRLSGSSGSWSWQTLDAGGLVGPGQIACARANNGNEIVAYKASQSGTRIAKVRESATGWGETAPPALGVLPFGMWATATLDSNNNPIFALFAMTATGSTAPFTGTLVMTTRSTNAGSAWTAWVSLGAFPGGINIFKTTTMGGYEFFVDSGSGRANVFFLADNGDLIENRGPLTGAGRAYVNHGRPPEGFDVNDGRVTATGFRTPFGHPPPYVESEWTTELRVTGNQGKIFAKHAAGSLAGVPWESTSTASGSLHAISSAALNCFPNTCSNRTIGIINVGTTGFNFFRFDALAISPFSRGPWTLASSPALTGVNPIQVRPVLTNMGSASLTGTQAVYVENPSNVVMFNLTANTKTNLGHP